MKETPFVKKEEADRAREMERRLAEIRKDAGILFAGVSVRPTKAGEAPTYYVWLGCSRSTDEKLMHYIVAHLFDEEIRSGLKIEVEAHRGVVLT